MPALTIPSVQKRTDKALFGGLLITYTFFHVDDLI